MFALLALPKCGEVNEQREIRSHENFLPFFFSEQVVVFILGFLLAVSCMHALLRPHLQRQLTTRNLGFYDNQIMTITTCFLSLPVCCDEVTVVTEGGSLTSFCRCSAKTAGPAISTLLQGYKLAIYSCLYKSISSYSRLQKLFPRNPPKIHNLGKKQHLFLVLGGPVWRFFCLMSQVT